MLRIEIATENAAFYLHDHAPGYELARILRDVANRIEAGATEGPIYDVNGNKVGRYDTILERE